MKPSIGRIVHYRLNASQCEQVNKRRADAARRGYQEDGTISHIGNSPTAGEPLPLVVTATWGGPDELINGQVLLDGNDSLWVTSARYSDADEAGTWCWPPRSS